MPPKTKSIVERQTRAIREREIMLLLQRGHSNKEMAALTGLAEQTVKNYLAELSARYGTKNRVQLALIARRLLATEGRDV